MQRFVKLQQQKAEANPNDPILQKTCRISAEELLALREEAIKYHVCQHSQCVLKPKGSEN